MSYKSMACPKCGNRNVGHYSKKDYAVNSLDSPLYASSRCWACGHCFVVKEGE